MSWDFETEASYQERLTWVEEFVRTEVEPLDYVVADPYDVRDPLRKLLIPPLQSRVQDEGLWAAHLTPELGGGGFGQLKLALLNEILGRTRCGPIVFGCQAPDSGNSEILSVYGSESLKRRYLDPLIRNEIVSAFSMTEPQGGSDPTAFTTEATLDGDEWVLNGEKWFTTNARFATFLLVLAKTDPGAPAHRTMSMFVVPSDAPGIEILRNVDVVGQSMASPAHAYIRYRDVRVPAENLLGKRGDGFVVSQTRLGGGRIHHAMRAVGMMRHALDMMCERAVSRQSGGKKLGEHQLVQAMLAESWIQLQQFRLLVLQTAWKIDKHRDYKMVRADISAVKAALPGVLRDVVGRAIQLHGALGVSDELPLASMALESFHLGLADGPTEIHKTTLGRLMLAGYEPATGSFPTAHVPTRRSEALHRYEAQIALSKEAVEAHRSSDGQ